MLQVACSPDWHPRHPFLDMATSWHPTQPFTPALAGDLSWLVSHSKSQSSFKVHPNLILLPFGCKFFNDSPACEIQPWQGVRVTAGTRRSPLGVSLATVDTVRQLCRHSQCLCACALALSLSGILPHIHSAGSHLPLLKDWFMGYVCDLPPETVTTSTVPCTTRPTCFSAVSMKFFISLVKCKSPQNRGQPYFTYSVCPVASKELGILLTLHFRHWVSVLQIRFLVTKW